MSDAAELPKQPSNDQSEYITVLKSDLLIATSIMGGFIEHVSPVINNAKKPQIFIRLDNPALRPYVRFCLLLGYKVPEDLIMMVID